MNRLFGGRVSESLPKIVNVLTVLETTNKAHIGYTELYENLCEYNHPNYSAMFGLYGKYLSPKQAEINKANGISKENLTTLLNLMNYVLTIFIDVLDKINVLYPILNQVCLDNLELKNE